MGDYYLTNVLWEVFKDVWVNGGTTSTVEGMWSASSPGRFTTEIKLPLSTEEDVGCALESLLDVQA